MLERGASIPRFPPGSRGKFTIGAIATSSGTVGVSARVTLARGFVDPNPDDNSATVNVPTIGLTPPGTADLSVSIMPYTAFLTSSGDGVFEFYVTVRNLGAGDAHFAVVQVPQIAGATVTQVRCAIVSSAARAGQSGQCPLNLTGAGLSTGLELIRFPAGTRAQFDIELSTPPVTGSTVVLSANITVPSGGSDPDLSNNSASVTASAQPR